MWTRSRAQRALAIGTVVLCATTTLLLADGPHYARSFASFLAGSLATFPTCRRISINLAKASEEYAVRAREEDRASVEEAFQQGQDTVLELVRQARDEAYRQLHQLSGKLEPALAKLVSGRLEEVDIRLEKIGDRCAPLLSTTTN